MKKRINDSASTSISGTTITSRAAAAVPVADARAAIAVAHRITLLHGLIVLLLVLVVG